jgi:hypothetical protein
MHAIAILYIGITQIVFELRRVKLLAAGDVRRSGFLVQYAILSLTGWTTLELNL